MSFLNVNLIFSNVNSEFGFKTQVKYDMSSFIRVTIVSEIKSFGP